MASRAIGFILRPSIEREHPCRREPPHHKTRPGPGSQIARAYIHEIHYHKRDMTTAHDLLLLLLAAAIRGPPNTATEAVRHPACSHHLHQRRRRRKSLGLRCAVIKTTRAQSHVCTGIPFAVVYHRLERATYLSASPRRQEANECHDHMGVHACNRIPAVQTLVLRWRPGTAPPCSISPISMIRSVVH
jgi:hypothetical protein